MLDFWGLVACALALSVGRSDVWFTPVAPPGEAQSLVFPPSCALPRQGCGLWRVCFSVSPTRPVVGLFSLSQHLRDTQLMLGFLSEERVPYVVDLVCPWEEGCLGSS